MSNPIAILLKRHGIDDPDAFIEKRLQEMMNEWRPIATAPKDGRDILSCGHKLCRVVCWNAASETWRANINAFVAVEPTHWQPLPPLPSPEAT